MWSSTECRFFVIVLSFGFLVNYGKTQGSSCLTPNKIPGTCIEITKCEPMIQLLRSLKRPSSEKVKQQINAYRCGTEEIIKICCPPGPIDLDPKTLDPPDVSHHKNVNILPQTCGYLDTGSKIVDGENAALNEFPWMALFQYQTAKGLRYLCGGTIIHKNYILTAAHCLTELSPTTKLVTIRVGEHSIKNETDCAIIDKRTKKIKCNPPVQDLKVEELIVHPKYGGQNGHNFNDIGLVRVSTINLDVENARPVCLPVGIVRDAPFNRVIVTGWGVSDIRTGASSDILQKVGLTIADKETCIRQYADFNKSLTYTQLCAGGDNTKDSCSGDSGGPAVIPAVLDEHNYIYVQQGIVSYGPKLCGITGYPGVYTVVKYYMDWILDNMKP